MRKRRCRGCDTYFRPDEGAPSWVKWCGEECREVIALRLLAKIQSDRKRQAEKKRLSEKKESRKQKREFYANDIKRRREAAVYWFNRYIRLRDSGVGCISCGDNRAHLKYDAGHFITAGSCTALRFNEANTNKQCVKCNRFLSGNLRLYRVALVAKFGEQAVQFLEGPQPTIKITADWYRDIEEKYKAKCKLDVRKAA